MSPSPSPSRHRADVATSSHTNGTTLDDSSLQKTTTNLTLSPELFEKLYLTPKVPPSPKKFANPTPMGFVGFVISTFTFAMVLMGWGGANGLAGVAGIFFFVGPVLLVLATVMEWAMGNFFPMMVMSLFAVFWLSFGLLQLPTLGLAASYSPTGDAAEGAASKEFNSVIGLYLIVWGFALFTFWIFTLKTNCIFAGIFLFVTLGAWLLAGAYFKTGQGDYVAAGKLQTAGGAVLFVVAALGWYMTFVIMAAEMRMPLSLPVGDLSRFWPATNVPLNDAEKQA